MQLWERFEKYTLMHNHRQGDDRIWAECLNQIRVSDGDDLPDEVIDKLIERVTNDPTGSASTYTWKVKAFFIEK